MAKKKRAKRNYRREYDSYHAKPEQKKRRATRNTARRKAARAGRVRKGDGKEVHHTKRSLKGRTKVVSRRANRKAGSPRKRKR
jgi:hypothetical protein